MTTNRSRRSKDPGRDFMQALRRDHAGLSRVLREIDAQAGRLTLDPDAAQPVLIDAFRYLLRYHHAFHHPREDRLFARIRQKDADLNRLLEKISHEHETGEHETFRLAEELAAATEETLRGEVGARLTVRINDYVRHTRTHMREEEAIFYSRAEQALGDDDWQAIITDDGPQDPITDLAELSATYPNLARNLGLATSRLGPAGPARRTSSELRMQVVALADLYGGLMHEAVDLTRTNFNRLRTVRGPVSLVQTAGAISSDNLRFAGQCVTRPSRWAINTSAGLVVGWLKPYMDQRKQ